MEGGNPVLNASHDIENPVPKPELQGIHSGQRGLRLSLQSLAGQEQGRPGVIDPNNPAGSLSQPGDDPAVTAAKVQDDIAGRDMAQNIADLRLEILLNAGRSDFVGLFEPLRRKFFLIIGEAAFST